MYRIVYRIVALVSRYVSYRGEMYGCIPTRRNVALDWAKLKNEHSLLSNEN